MTVSDSPRTRDGNGLETGHSSLVSSVNPVEGLVDDLIADSLVEDLVHKTLPEDGSLVFRTNRVVPVDISERRCQSIGFTMHDEGGSGEIAGIEGGV